MAAFRCSLTASSLLAAAASTSPISASFVIGANFPPSMRYAEFSSTKTPFRVEKLVIWLQLR